MNKDKLTETVRLCYQFAFNVRRRDFYKGLTSSKSVFGVDETAPTRRKVVTDLKYQLHQAVGIRHNQVAPLKNLLIKGANDVEELCQQIETKYDLTVYKKSYKVKMDKPYFSSEVLAEIVKTLTYIGNTSYRICPTYQGLFVVELCQGYQALETLNVGTGVLTFDALITTLLKNKDYFAEGYPKDLLTYDAQLVKDGGVKSIWYNPAYCATRTQMKHAKPPYTENYKEWAINN